MRLRMGGLRSLQRNRTAMELNGSATATSACGDRRHYQHRWPISSGASVTKKWKVAHECSLPRKVRHQTPQTDHGPDARKAPKQIAARFYQLKQGTPLRLLT